MLSAALAPYALDLAISLVTLEDALEDADKHDEAEETTTL